MSKVVWAPDKARRRGWGVWAVGCEGSSLSVGWGAPCSPVSVWPQTALPPILLANWLATACWPAPALPLGPTLSLPWQGQAEPSGRGGAAQGMWEAQDAGATCLRGAAGQAAGGGLAAALHPHCPPSVAPCSQRRSSRRRRSSSLPRRRRMSSACLWCASAWVTRC